MSRSEYRRLRPTVRAGLDEALALVDPQRLRVHARELGRHRDDVQRAIVRSLGHRSYTSRCSRGFPGNAAASASSAALLLVVELLRDVDVERDEQVAGRALRRAMPRPLTFWVVPACVPPLTLSVTGSRRASAPSPSRRARPR